MKKIALFGATGLTGKLFLEKVLKAGYTVNALVRDPDKLVADHSSLQLVKGSVLDLGAVKKTVENCDVVVSLFGHVKDSPEWLQTDGTRYITQAMKQFNVVRIISLSGGGLPFPEKDKPKLMDKLIRSIMKIAVPNILNDAIQHHVVLQESGLDWVIVRAPRLTNDPPKGRYRIGWVGVNSSTTISRSDLADFLTTQLEDENFNHQMPFVSY